MSEQSQEIIKSVCIDNFIEQRNAIFKRIAEAKQLLLEARQIATSIAIVNDGAYRSFESLLQGHRSYTLDIIEKPTVVSKRIDSACWRHLMVESGMMSFLDTKAREEWDKAILENEVIELNLDNIKSTFKNLYASRELMFERGIEELFRGLSWEYKTNVPVKFGKRIIHKISWGRYESPSSNACNKIDDLLRCFKILDAKPEEDYRRCFYIAMVNAFHNRDYGYEDDYLDVKIFKNGNIHILFTRPDLVDKLNKIIAKNHPNILAAPK